MALQERFPLTTAVFRALTGRWAKRIAVFLIVLLLSITTAARLRMWYLARRAQNVLQALAAIQIDQTTEQELNRLLPQAKHQDWDYQENHVRSYYVKIANEDDPIPSVAWRVFRLVPPSMGQLLLDWTGYRYFDFAAGVSVEGGRVSGVSYGLANRFTAPRYAGQAGYAVSARSFHGVWQERPYHFRVSSAADSSPQYRPIVSSAGLNIKYAADAPRTITDRLFRLNLSCFWGLHGCESGRQIAPELWQDVERIREQSREQLASGACPESIVEGRMRYLPDVTVSLVEVTKPRRITPKRVAGYKSEEWVTTYKGLKMLRDPNGGRFRGVVVPWMTPEAARRPQYSQNRPHGKIGSQLLYFSYPIFDSCRFIPATPSAIEIIKRSPVPAKHWADQVMEGLM